MTLLDRWGGLLVLQGIVKGGPNETMNAIDDALGEAHASILDVHFFSGVHVSFAFEVHGSDVSRLGEALGPAGIALDETSVGALGEAKELDRAVTGTLAVTFAHGDPNVRHEIPKVPADESARRARTARDGPLTRAVSSSHSPPHGGEQSEEDRGQGDRGEDGEGHTGRCGPSCRDPTRGRASACQSAHTRASSAGRRLLGARARRASPPRREGRGSREGPAREPGLLARNAQWSAEMLDLAMHGAGRKAKWNLANNASEAERAMVQHRRCFDLLLTHGAWVNGDPIRITPLQHAIDVAYIPFVEALLERAADPHVEDDGETVLDRVRQRGGKSSEYGKARDRQILALLEAVRPA